MRPTSPVPGPSKTLEVQTFLSGMTCADPRSSNSGEKNSFSPELLTSHLVAGLTNANQMQEAAKIKASPLNSDRTEKEGKVVHFDELLRQTKEKCTWIEDEFLTEKVGLYLLELIK